MKIQNAERSITVRSNQVPVLQNMIAGRTHGFLIITRKNKPFTTVNSMIKCFSYHAKHSFADLTPRKLTLYDGRYSFATRLEKARIPLGYISVLMGHSNTTTTARYLSRNEKQAQAAFRKAFA